MACGVEWWYFGSLRQDDCSYYAPELRGTVWGWCGENPPDLPWGCPRAWDNACVIWLGEKSGYLTDWVTQQWVKMTGVRVRLEEFPWLEGPVGRTRGIGKEFFEEYARVHRLEVVRSGTRGLIREFGALRGAESDPAAVAAAVADFYERTSEYELDAWSEWSVLLKPFGTALAWLFSRRLQQLNIPLSPLDSSRGMSSEVVELRDPRTGELKQTAWIRELRATQRALYAGSYSVCRVPGFPDSCVRVVFPLPNGSATVILRPQSHADGSFSLLSSGSGFGDPGFYFVVRGWDGWAWARYVRAMRERITVYGAEAGTVRADHMLWLRGTEFLRLHYRMRGA